MDPTVNAEFIKHSHIPFLLCSNSGRKHVSLASFVEVIMHACKNKDHECIVRDICLFLEHNQKPKMTDV